MCDKAFLFLEWESAEVGGRERGRRKEDLVYEGVGFAILSDDGGCSAWNDVHSGALAISLVMRENMFNIKSICFSFQFFEVNIRYKCDRKV